MPDYANGYIPENLLIVFARGANTVDGAWFHGLPAATYARHLKLVELARARTGKTLRISDGWGAYRPYAAQLIARSIYGNGAAWPGTSSHGGLWEGRQTAAMDYSNWGEVYGWDRAAFAADCYAAGLTPNMIVPARGYPDEPWHVIDLDPWGAVPASEGATDFNAAPAPEPTPAWEADDKESDMFLVYINDEANQFGGGVIYALTNGENSWVEFRTQAAANTLAKRFGDAAGLSYDEWPAFKAAAGA